MKKLILAVFIFVFSVGVACADCTVTINLAVSTDPDAALQSVYYDPDNTVGADEFVPSGCSGDMALTQCVFTIPAPMPNDEAWVVTTNAGGTESYESAHISVGGITGSSVSTIITNCTP